MPSVMPSTVSSNRIAVRYVFPRVSVTVSVGPACHARIATAIQLPVVLLEVNASDDEVVVPASLPACWTRVIPAGAGCVVAVAVFEYGPGLPAASIARTRYEKLVDAGSPESVNVVPVPAGAPTCANDEQPAPWHRSIRYPVTATLSVAGVQFRAICPAAGVDAVRAPGAVGACVSPLGVTVKVTPLLGVPFT